MKRQLLLLFLFSNIFCSLFLRKLEEKVTEESCQKEGKKYQETVTYECTTGTTTFEVAKKEDCKKGIWTKTKQCSAKEVDVDKCTGTPQFITTEATDAVCKLDNEIITTLTTKATCETKLIWTEGTCSIQGRNDKTSCEKNGEWTSTGDEQGTCSYGSATTKTDCENTKGSFTSTSETVGTCSAEGTFTSKTECKNAGGDWTSTDEEEGTCTIGSATTKSTCEATHGVFTSTSTTVGTCTIDGKATKNDCETAKGEWTDGYCSVKQFTTKVSCDGKTPKFTEAQAATEVCKLNDIVISSRTTQKTCEVALKVEEGGSCSNKKVTKEADCEAEAKVEEVTVAECVDDKSSNSAFLKAVNFALFVICLLF